MGFSGPHREHMHQVHKKEHGKTGKWISSAINPANKGALHKELKVPMGKNIPEKKLEKAAHSKSPTLKRRAILAETLKSFKNKR